MATASSAGSVRMMRAWLERPGAGADTSPTGEARASATVWAPAARPLWRSRAAVVVIAVAADAIAWMVATAGGVDFEVGLPGQAPREVTLVNVLVMTALFIALGWAARAVLDRIAKPRAAAGPGSR